MSKKITPVQRATRRYTDKMSELGMVRIHPWIAPRDRDKVMEFARHLRNQYFSEIYKAGEIDHEQYVRLSSK